MKLNIFLLFFLFLPLTGKGQTFDFKGPYSDADIALVKKNGKYGFVDRDNKIVIPCIYSDISADDNPYNYQWYKLVQYLSVFKDGKWGYIDKNGNEKIPFIYEEVKSGECWDGQLLTVKKNGKYGIVDLNNNTIVPFEYEDLDTYYGTDPIRAKKNGQYGFITIKNEVAIPFIYSTAGSFGYNNEYNYATVSKDGKYGYIDLSGEVIVPLQYEFACNMHDGKHGAVVKGNKVGFVNNKGDLVVPFEYDVIYYHDNKGNAYKGEIYFWKEGEYAVVSKNNKYGAIRTDGTVIVPLIYSSCGVRGNSGAVFKKDGKSYYYDYGGNLYSSDVERSEKMVEKLAEQGYANAQFSLGDKYYGAKDYANSLMWFEKASAQGYKKADRYLGHQYYYGYGVERNYKKALSYYLSAATENDRYALYYLGWMYEHGQGVEKNLSKALDYYKQSSKLGHKSAQDRVIALSGDNPNPPNNNVLASLSYNSPLSSSTSGYTVKVGVNSSSAITSSKVFVNGQLSRGVNAVKNDGYDYTIQENVVLAEGNNTIRIEATNAAGTATLEKTVRYEKAVPMNKATLALSSPTKVSQSAYSLQVKVNSSSTITNTKVLVNGQAERGVTPVKNDGAQFVINKQLTLKEGNNTILVEVTNAAGTASMNTVVNYTKSVSNNVVVVPSNQQKCIALVIGNSNYAKATSLTNPANDAKDVANKLKSLGFTVIEREDLGLRQFNEAVSDFGTKAAQYDVALFYYAGHAIENEGVNYLIPVDATLEKRVDLPYQCINAQYVLDNLEESQSKANIIILDACRNNPIERGWSRSLSGGLAQMIAPTGTFFMFSTSPGRTADDGVGRNSPFTQAFLSCLDIPNIQLEIFAKEVIRKVKDNTQNRQIPWSASSFYGDFYFNKK